MKIIKNHRFISVPNAFVKEYMAEANGEFVKLYLLLLYMESTGEESKNYTLEDLADFLQCTEGDIMRGLLWWEKRKVINLKRDGKEIRTVMFLFPNADTDPNKEPTEKFIPDVPQESSAKKKKRTSKVESQQGGKAKSDTGKYLAKKEVVKEDTPHVTRQLPETEPDSEEAAVKEIVYTAEQYLGENLSEDGAEKILYLYQGLHMSANLITYLIEYCVSRGKKSAQLVQREGLLWYSRHITTLKDAQEKRPINRKEHRMILKACGITARDAVAEEKLYFDNWLDEYHFSLEMICRACEQTVLNTGSMKLLYVDRILQDWLAKDIHTIQEAEKNDEKFREEQKKKREDKEKKKADTAKRNNGNAAPNKFHNFEERDYDYDQLEAYLFRKNFPEAFEEEQNAESKLQ